MTDLIPRDAAIRAVREYINDTGSELEKWDIDQVLHSIPTIDPAAIRDAALTEAAELCDRYPYVEGVKTAILALIGEKK